ncbi:MAG: hypothetical protein Q4G63_11960 [Bacteroidia bacterium]|nr:hypothetical protein [Bacteroidia bacterium]
MKKTILIIVAFALFTSFGYSQSVEQLKQEVEKLTQENKTLKHKADFCNLYSQSDKYEVKSFNENYEVKVLSVIGNKNDQTVDILFTLRHEIPNQKITLHGDEFVAYDETGNSYTLKAADFSGNKGVGGYVYHVIPTDVLIQGKLTFRNILSKTDRLKKVSGRIDTENNDGGDNKQKGEVEFTNLLINWK